jgi:hypothetical protein
VTLPRLFDIFRLRYQQQTRYASSAVQMFYQAQLPEHARFHGEENASRHHRSADQNLRQAIANSSQHIRCATRVDLHPTAMANLARRVSKTSRAQSLRGDAFARHLTLRDRHHRTTCLPSFDEQAIRSPVPMKYRDTRRRRLHTRCRSTSTRRSCRPSLLHIRLHAEHRLVAAHPTHASHRTTLFRTYA